MLVSSKKFLTGVAVTSALCVAGWSQATQSQPQAQPEAQGQAAQGQAAQGQASQPAAGAAKEKKPKDQGEYDIFTAVTKETDHTKRVGLLDQWKQKYPETDYTKDRLLYYLDSYRNLNQLDKMIATSKELLALDPADANAMFWMATLIPSMPGSEKNPEYVGLAEKAGQGIIANLDKTFAPANKQANVTDEQWKQARRDMEVVAYKSAGWSAMINKNQGGAKENFQKALQANPGAAEVSYWMGNMILADKNPQTIPEGLYHLARAASYEGPGALNPQGRASVNDFLTKYYNAFHGTDAAGLDQIKAQAKASPLPPAGFTIRSKVEIAQDKLKEEAAKEAADPIGANWKRFKEGLTGPSSGEFVAAMKDAAIPYAFRGTVVDSTPKTIVLAMSDKTTGELTLQPSEGTFPKVAPGTELTFENAVGKDYAASPFMVTMEIDRSKVKGLPAGGGGGAKKPAARKPKGRR